MASPHVAGAAALLLQRHPGWTVEQVKSALVTTGSPVYATAKSTVEVPVTREGGGLIDVSAADQPLLFTAPTSLSFGLVRPGQAPARTVALSDAGGGAGIWSAAIDAQSSPPGTTVTVPATATIPGRLVVTVHAGATEGDAQGFVVLTAERRPAPRAVLGARRDARPGEASGHAAHPPGHLRGERFGSRVADRLVPLPRRSDRVRRSHAAGRAGAGLPDQARPGGLQHGRRGRRAGAREHDHAPPALRRRREPADGRRRASARHQPVLEALRHAGARGGRDRAAGRHVRRRLRQPVAGHRRALHVPLLGRRPQAAGASGC